jgi:hypothetical protein
MATASVLARAMLSGIASRDGGQRCGSPSPTPKPWPSTLDRPTARATASRHLWDTS